MRLTRLSTDDASPLAVAVLGLDAHSVDLFSIEGIAGSLRRAASFLCPTSPGRLVDTVVDAIRPVSDGQLSRDEVAETLELLVASGDLLELRHGRGQTARHLYLAPPSFLERLPGCYLLIGIRPFGRPLIEDDLAQAIEYEGHTRSLLLDPADGPAQLLERGLHALKKDRWVASPASDSPRRLVDRYGLHLDAASQAGEIEGLVILDPSTRVDYYRGRWRSPIPTDTGDFVVRRPQEYGADLWCLARLSCGVPQRLLELPLDPAVVPGRDEAWRYQAAIDSLRGTPQRFRVRHGATPADDVTLDFFSPLPGFAERYVQFTGLALGKSPGALFSFRLSRQAAEDVSTFLADKLWMTQEEAQRGV